MFQQSVLQLVALSLDIFTRFPCRHIFLAALDIFTSLQVFLQISRNHSTRSDYLGLQIFFCWGRAVVLCQSIAFCEVMAKFLKGVRTVYRLEKGIFAFGALRAFAVTFSY
eukprot:g48916.t1